MAPVTRCCVCGMPVLPVSAGGAIVELDPDTAVWVAEDYQGTRTWHQMTGRVALVEHKAVCRGRNDGRS